MKGIINMVELIFVLIILFIAFGVLLPGFSYKSKWPTAYILLTSRDLILTIDRTDKLYEYSFDPTALSSFIENATVNATSIIWWPEIKGTFKKEIYVGCNCTKEQFQNLTQWSANLKINSRQISLIPCYTNLDRINLCKPGNNYPDVLVIWGYKNLTAFKDVLIGYMSKENGIVEIMDFDQDADEVQRNIFGVDTGGAWDTVDYDTVTKPNSSSNITYQVYKMFYHLSRSSEAKANVTIVGCTSGVTNNLTLWNTNYTFSVCNDSKVYFDTDANGTIDTGPLQKGDDFTLKKIVDPIGFYNFSLSFVGTGSVGVSFEHPYNFTDFCLVPAKKRPVPYNNEVNRVSMQAVKSVGGSEETRAYCSILNGTFARTAWIADFSRNGLEKVGDDQEQILISLILWASNKKSTSLTYSQIKTGFISTYINTVNEDMFEIYTFKLGMGQPY